MRAVVVEEYGAPPRVREVAEPVCPPDGVVVAVHATGLCRSDWHGWMGHDPGIVLPHVPGHELSGVVVEVGPQVRRARVGQRVTVPFVCACGVCATCGAGAEQVCEDQFQPGFTAWGSFAEQVALPRADLNLVEVPEQMSLETAAALGCRFATAYRAVTAHGRVERGAWVAVHGCGGVGLSAVQVAVARGARVVAVDVSDGALELARTLGAEHTVRAETGDDGRSDTAATIRELTGGGAHVGLDAIGGTATARASVESLRPRGRHVQVGLMVGEHADARMPMARVVALELELLGSHGMAARDYPAMLAEIASGRLEPQRLVTGLIGLDQAPEALMAMSQGSPVGTVVIDPRRVS